MAKMDMSAFKKADEKQDAALMAKMSKKDSGRKSKRSGGRSSKR
jgi:hypothetical protein